MLPAPRRDRSGVGATAAAGGEPSFEARVRGLRQGAARRRLRSSGFGDARGDGDEVHRPPGRRVPQWYALPCGG
eukprot:10983847-Alexandrium_andersonii.AAC.1